MLTTLGVDLGKSAIHICGLNGQGRVLFRKKLKREGFSEWLANSPPCAVTMEACGGSHAWARKARAFGHQAQLIAGQFVKPFVKSNKNDAIDAEAIAEAAQRPNMRFVPVKTTEQQDIQGLHRIRDGLVKMRTALANQCRGLLLENGVVVPQGRRQLETLLPTLMEEETTGSQLFREMLRGLYEHLKDITERIEKVEGQLGQVFKTHEACQRLATIPGIGLLTATALFASVGVGSDFKNGRQLAAWVGLVPRQYTTGGKPRLLGISKRGDAYLRKLLIHGARAVLCGKPSGYAQREWALRIAAKGGPGGVNRATVALANKNARIAWAVLAHGTSFTPRQNQAAETEKAA